MAGANMIFFALLPVFFLFSLSNYASFLSDFFTMQEGGRKERRKETAVLAAGLLAVQ